MKLVWLVSVPVMALVALFAMRSAPTLAGPGCAADCAAVSSDQSVVGILTTTYAAGASIYQQVAGQYCSDKTGGQIYIPAGSTAPSGLTCPAVTGSATAVAATGGSATAAATRAATSAATGSATATGTATR